MSTRALVRFAVVGLWGVLLAGCSDVMVSSEPPSPPPPPPPSAAVLLEDIVIATLPAPYYHFEYDPGGRIAVVSFASGLTNYNVTYAGGRIAELQNNILVNHDRLLYGYDDSGRVAVVREVDDTGATFTLVVLSYDGHKLIGLERDRRVDGGFIIDKTMSMAYDSDGNLQVLTELRPDPPGFLRPSRAAARSTAAEGQSRTGYTDGGRSELRGPVHICIRRPEPAALEDWRVDGHQRTRRGKADPDELGVLLLLRELRLRAPREGGGARSVNGCPPQRP